MQCSPHAVRLRCDISDADSAIRLLLSRRFARQALGFQPFAIFMKGLLRELIFPHGLLCITPSLGLFGLALLRRWLLTGCV
jgi:hypothetical protein